VRLDNQEIVKLALHELRVERCEIIEVDEDGLDEDSEVKMDDIIRDYESAGASSLGRQKHQLASLSTFTPLQDRFAKPSDAERKATRTRPVARLEHVTRHK